jgi:hypothetical protein
MCYVIGWFKTAAWPGGPIGFVVMIGGFIWEWSCVNSRQVCVSGDAFTQQAQYLYVRNVCIVYLCTLPHQTKSSIENDHISKYTVQSRVLISLHSQLYCLRMCTWMADNIYCSLQFDSHLLAHSPSLHWWNARDTWHCFHVPSLMRSSVVWYYYSPSAMRSAVASLLIQNETQDRTTSKQHGRYTLIMK